MIVKVLGLVFLFIKVFVLAFLFIIVIRFPKCKSLADIIRKGGLKVTKRFFGSTVFTRS